MPFGDTPAFDRGIDRGFMMPQGSLITSALSNKGNPTGFGQDNTFRVLDQQEIRLVDDKGNLLFSGVGPEAAKQAVSIGQNLSNTLGRKADWTIQTGTQYTNTDGTVGTRWDDVAHEKKNKSTLGVIGDVLGTALPIAVSMIPGLQVLGPVASSIAAGGAGAALRGDNVLKGAVMGGLSSAGGELLGPVIQGAGVGANAAQAIGTGLGSTVGGLATGQSLKNSLIGGVTSGGLSYLGGEVFGPETDSLQQFAKEYGIYDVPTDIYSANFGGSSAPSGFTAPSVVASSFPSNLTVTGTRLPTSFSTGLGSSLFASSSPSSKEPVYDDRTIEVEAKRLAEMGQPTTGFAVNMPEATTQSPDLTLTAQKTIEQPTTGFAVNMPAATTQSPDLTLTAQKTVEEPQGVGGPLIPVDTGAQAGLDGRDIEVTAIKEPTGNLSYVPSLVDDVMQAEMAGKTTPPEKTAVEKLNDIGDYAKLAGYTIPLLEALFGGGGKGTSGVRYPGAGTGTLNPLFSAKLPEPTMPGAAGNFAVRPQSDFGVVGGQPRDWTKYGFGPEASFFNYVPQRGSAPATAPVATPSVNEASAPAMYVPDDMRFAEGGPFAAKRTEFAVHGPGDGRSDDIPAMLSDGEYVMDAETVSLLGNGSFRGGAKKLDQFRVNLRKHKGQKLAKGEFSVNAKQPEQYLAGGRI